MKKTKRIVCLLLTAAILLPLLVGCASAKRPLEYFKNAMERTLDDSVLGEAIALLGEVMEEGALKLSFGGTDLISTTLSKADVTLYLSGDDDAAMADALLKFGDTKYDAKLWLSEEELVLASDAFLGSTTLGVEIDALERDLQNSIFRNNSGTVYAVPSIDGDTATDIRTYVEGIFSRYASLSDRFEELDELTDEFLEALTAHARYVNYTDNGKLFLDLTVDNSMLSRALRATWEWAVSDRSFCSALREYAAVLDAMQTVRDGAVSSEYTHKVDAWLLDDAEIEALCTKIDNLPAFTFSLSTSIRKLTRKVLYLDVSFDMEGRAFAFGFDLTEEDTAALHVTRGGVSHRLTLSDIDDGFSSYSAKVSYERAAGEAVLLSVNGDFALDGGEDRYTLSLGDGVNNRTLGGVFLLESDTLTLSVDRVVINGEDRRLALSFTATTDADMPDAPSYLNFATITEQRYAPLAERAGTTKTQLLTSLLTSGVTKNTPRELIAALLGV